MSGICGIVNLDGAPVDPALLKRMAEAAAYRGPDGIYYWIEGNVGLAHLTLHTTPESVREKQPLLNRRGDIVLTADARVDNRDELTRTLTAKGYLQEQAPTDADLILAAYECWGEECPEQIIGDFAFAVWDRRQQQLLCVRDPLGIKPLHYARIGDILCIASEAQQILQHPAIPCCLDEVAMADHLVNNCIDQERTMFVNVRKVPAAHRLVASKGRIQQERYWDIDPGVRITYRSDDDYAAHFLDIFQRAVADRLRTQADTIGVLMSGGLDSCSIAAMVKHMDSQRTGLPGLIAYSYAFEQLKDCDERVYSRVMATELEVEIEYVNAERFWLLGDSVAFRPSLETPFIGWASIDHHILGRLKKRGAYAILTGHTVFYSRLGGSSVVHAHRLLRGDLSVLWEMAQFARERGMPYHFVLYSQIAKPLLPSGFNGDSSSPLPEWITTDFARKTNLVERLSRPRCPLNVSQQARHRHAVWLGSLRRAVYYYDRTAASFGVEVRHPFLDRRLFEFLMSIPPKQSYQPGQNRLILRRAMKGILPDVIRLREDKSKMGSFFDFSLCEMENLQISAMLETPLLGKLGVVDAQGLRRAYNQCEAGTASIADGELWFAITLELWLRQHREALGAIAVQEAEPVALAAA